MLTVSCTNTEQGTHDKYGVALVSHSSALQRCACSMPASSTKPIDAALQDDASGYSNIGSMTCTHRQSFRNGDTKPLSALEELTTISPNAEEQATGAFVC